MADPASPLTVFSPGNTFAVNRNIEDGAYYVASFALPNAASTSVDSAKIDLASTYPYRNEDVEIELSVPALTATICPNGDTVTYIIYASTASSSGTVTQTILSDLKTGSSGVPAYTKRVRVAPNSARYIYARVTFGASTTDGSALSATVRLLF